MSSASYQVGFYGVLDERHDELFNLILQRFAEAGVGAESVSILYDVGILGRDRKKPFVLIVLCGETRLDDDYVIQSAIEDSNTIIPVVNSIEAASDVLPSSISGINAVDYSKGAGRIVSAVLENFRILRKERRVFISYKRSESQDIAIQLYECLDSRGFDVFLDTRSVPPGEDFQGVLWHRMADSDVVVLLGTPQFKDSRWTAEELARANAASIQIVYLQWPGVAADPECGLSEFFPLSPESFVSERLGTTLRSDVADEIVTKVEEIRARALAARTRGLVDAFCDRAREFGAVTSVQPQRYITVSLPSAGSTLAVVPAIGVPSSVHYNDINSSIRGDDYAYQSVWIIYEPLGILSSWIRHLKWLNDHLPLKAVSLVDGVDEMLGG